MLLSSIALMAVAFAAIWPSVRTPWYSAAYQMRPRNVRISVFARPRNIRRVPGPRSMVSFRPGQVEASIGVTVARTPSMYARTRSESVASRVSTTQCTTDAELMGQPVSRA